MSGDGFADLRLNQQEGQVNESFWPSFTDIMTVIVMIFMIAMVVLLMRNMELVNQLRSTMAAEKTAAELAMVTGKEKETLALELHIAENKVAEMQLQLMRLEEQDIRQSTTITEQLQQIAQVTSEKDRLMQQAAQLNLVRLRLETDLESNSTRLASAEQLITGFERNLERLQTRFQTTQQQLSKSQEDTSRQQRIIEDFQTQRQQTEDKYLLLVGEFDDIKVKYDKLIKPARSPKERYLIEVRYWKQGKTFKISYRENGTGPYQGISRSRLDKALARLKAVKKNGLYIKVIFPEDSGLSYDQAWKFTNHLHVNFDYYFEESGEVQDAATPGIKAPATKRDGE